MPNATVKKELDTEPSLYNCCQILTVSRFEKSSFHAPFDTMTQLHRDEQL